MAPTKLIIDTDPGNDDVLAMLLAVACQPEELEVLLISVTYGNVDVQNCLRNVVTMFHIIEKEMAWRKEQGLPKGFDTLLKRKPLVAVGADGPLGDQRRMADYFHGTDGLAGVHESHPHFTPAETWKRLFEQPPKATELSKSAPSNDDPTPPSPLFTASTAVSWREILRILKEEPENTVSIAAIGPMTNLALAAAEDPITLMRAKEIIVMGGAIEVPGNMTPLAEFNTFADAHAAARVYALSSPNPKTTMPPHPPPTRRVKEEQAPPEAPPLKDYPPPKELGDRRLKIVLFPLDITEQHLLYEPDFNTRVEPLVQKGSPLAAWMSAWVGSTFRKMESLYPDSEVAILQLHDPMTIWYALDGESNVANWAVKRDIDIRVESAAQWSRGACIIDKRPRRELCDDDGEGDEIAGDEGGWLSKRRGNRLGWCVKSPGEELLAKLMLDRILA